MLQVVQAIEMLFVRKGGTEPPRQIARPNRNSFTSRAGRFQQQESVGFPVSHGVKVRRTAMRKRAFPLTHPPHEKLARLETKVESTDTTKQGCFAKNQPNRATYNTCFQTSFMNVDAEKRERGEGARCPQFTPVCGHTFVPHTRRRRDSRTDQ